MGKVHGNPWKSTDILRKFQQVFKMVENAEKPGFTFFAFLPPYIGVSGFLAYPKGKIFSRSIDWYRKFFISCPLAREIHGHIKQKINRCSKCMKMPKNEVLRFLRFLPRYIGVSGFLAYPKGKNFSRSIDWYRKYFISCPLARCRKSMQKKKPFPCLYACPN